MNFLPLSIESLKILLLLVIFVLLLLVEEVKFEVQDLDLHILRQQDIQGIRDSNILLMYY
jgi:hypothetical protein